MNIERKIGEKTAAAKWYHAVFVIACMLFLMVIGVGFWGNDPHCAGISGKI